MVFEINENELLCSFILDYSDNCLSPAERKSFSDLMRSNSILKERTESNVSVKKLLGRLPKVKARPSFDRKMAASFAMELERETIEANRKNLASKLTVRQ